MDKGHTSLTREELPGKIVFGTLSELEILEASSPEQSRKEIFRHVPAHPTWDSTRTRIIFSLWRSGRRLYSIDQNGDSLCHLVGGPDDVYDYASVSPDGKTLAFLKHRSSYRLGWESAPTGKLMVMDMDEKEPFLLLGEPILSGRPSWSIDSKRLMFASLDSLVVVMDIETGEQDTLWEGTLPSWSPDGSWVAYYDKVLVYISNLATGEVRLAAPRWNLRRSRGGPVYLIHSEGEELVWSPDSRYLLYYARLLAELAGGADYMVVRISDKATLGLTGTGHVPTGACWFE